MLEKIFSLLHFADWQVRAFHQFFDLLKQILTGQLPLRRMLAGLMVLAELFGTVAFGLPSHPFGQELDLSGYEMVFFDDFNGDSLNTDVWRSRGDGPRRTGFNSSQQITVEDGVLKLTGSYREDGMYGAGWYAGAVSLKQKYCRGYFEIRCICNKDKGFWSAFWIQADHPYDARSNGGIDGAEIDIFEAMSADEKLPYARNSVTQTIWCNGVDDDMESLDRDKIGTFCGKNIYEEYNTYGLEWTEDEYIFYVNGVETGRSSYGLGVSRVGEEVIVSLEIPDELPESITSDLSYSTQMIVDYVKIYSKQA